MPDATACARCDRPKEDSRAGSHLCRKCDHEQKEAWKAKAPRCPTCGGILPKRGRRR